MNTDSKPAECLLYTVCDLICVFRVICGEVLMVFVLPMDEATVR